mgnify:CR=1 FL=1
MAPTNIPLSQRSLEDLKRAVYVLDDQGNVAIRVIWLNNLKTPVDTLWELPTTDNILYDLRYVTSEKKIYVWNGTDREDALISSWWWASTTEYELDRWRPASRTKKFTLTIWWLLVTDKVIVTESGNPWTGKTETETLMNIINYATVSHAWEVTIYAKSPWLVWWKHKIYLQIITS